MTTQALEQNTQRSQPIAWGWILTGLAGLLLLASGLLIINYVENSPERRTSAITWVEYEPVIDDVRAEKRVPTGLYWVPVVLNVPDKISVSQPLRVELAAPLVTDVELVKGNTWLDKWLDRGFDIWVRSFVDGPAIQDFIQLNPSVNEGITLDGNKTYSITMVPLEDDETRIEFQDLISEPQHLSADTQARWSWIMTGMQKGLALEQSQLEVLVHDQDGNLAGQAIVALRFANTRMHPNLVNLMIIVGMGLLLIGFGHFLNPWAEGVLARYAKEKGVQAVPHQHRFRAPAISWAVTQEQKLQEHRRKCSPFGVTAKQSTGSVSSAPFLPMAWLQLQAYLPGTLAFRRRVQYLTLMRSQERIRKFQGLSTLNETTKQRLCPAVRRLSRQLERHNLLKETLRDPILWLTYLALLFNIASAFLLTDLISNLIPPRLWDTLFNSNLFLYLLGWGLQLLIFSLLFLPLAIPIVAIDQVFEFLRSRYYPDAIIVDKLINILANAEGSGPQWMSGETKGEVLSDLEVIATSMERFLPGRLGSRDVNTDQLFHHRAVGIAAALRELKLWVLTPKADTRTHFVSRIATTLEQFLRSEWDVLPQAQPPSSLRPSLLIPRVFHALWNVIQTVVIGVIPFIAVRLAFYFGYLERASQIAQYLLLGTILFGILTVIIALDPRFNDKINILKSIKELLLPGQSSTG